MIGKINKNKRRKRKDRKSKNGQPEDKNESPKEEENKVDPLIDLDSRQSSEEVKISLNNLDGNTELAEERKNTNDIEEEKGKEKAKRPQLKFDVPDDKENNSDESDESSDNVPNTVGMSPEGATDLKITLNQIDESDDKPQTVNLSFGSHKLDFEHSHEIHTERETTPVRIKIKKECDEIRKNIEFDEDEEDIGVVKDEEEGTFYTLKHQKSIPVKPILKSRSCMVVIPDDISERSNVNFELQDNEIRDFKKNDRVDWHPSKTQVGFAKSNLKKEKKQKGKGKNRRMTTEEKKSKEQKKIEKARKKREEQEKLFEEMDVDDNFDEDNEMEACNAPSTRKANSQQTFDNKSPFHGESLVDFTDMAPTKQNSADALLEVPKQSAQLECDLRSLKDNISAQREYLCKIEPENI